MLVVMKVEDIIVCLNKRIENVGSAVCNSMHCDEKLEATCTCILSQLDCLI